MRYEAVVVLVMVALSALEQVSGPSTDPAQGAVWDLTVIYRDDAAAERERVAIIAELPSLTPFKGHLGDNAATLRKALDRRSMLSQRARRVSSYASLKVAEDARVGSSQALLASAGDLMDKLGTATSFYDPEIIAIGRTRIAAFEAAEPGLERHRRSLELLLRRADHVLGPETEAAIAASSALRQSPSNTHDVFTNAEMPWPTIMVHGKSTRLTREAYRNLLVDPDRDTRRAAFEAFTGALDEFKNTQAALLQAHVGGAAYEAGLRHYPSSVAFLLADDAMPNGSFDVLSRAAQGEQSVIDRYLRLRAQALGLADLHPYDLAVPLAGGTRTYYPLAEGEALVLKALAPLGQEYVNRLADGFRARRMHATASPGKSPGAMTDPVDDSVPPFVLLTYTGDTRSVSTLAHEWGHAMHMDLARAAQPFETADFSVFIGDTPSLLNEMLLDDYMIEHAANRDERIAALSEAVELLRGTYYRVLPMMRLEMAERAAADKGEPLTADRLTKLNCNEVRAFYGADRGITTVDPAACLTWTISQEPYDDMYFYKYLTAVSAAAYFAGGIEHGDSGLRDRYFALLRAGGSEDPYVLLKRAGFDASDLAAYTAIGHRFEGDVDALERELRAAGRLGGSSPAAEH
jgi:oligoendopeptidase F